MGDGMQDPGPYLPFDFSNDNNGINLDIDFNFTPEQLASDGILGFQPTTPLNEGRNIQTGPAVYTRATDDAIFQESVAGAASNAEYQSYKELTKVPNNNDEIDLEVDFDFTPEQLASDGVLGFQSTTALNEGDDKQAGPSRDTDGEIFQGRVTEAASEAQDQSCKGATKELGQEQEEEVDINIQKEEPRHENKDAQDSRRYKQGLTRQQDGDLELWNPATESWSKFFFHSWNLPYQRLILNRGRCNPS